MNDLIHRRVETPVQGRPTLSASARRWQKDAGSLVGIPLVPPESERMQVLSELKAGLWGAGPEYVATALLRLQAHYWRPEFTPAQAKELYADFMDDLGHIPPDILDEACAAYRRDPEARFFPRPGQLLAIAEPLLAERRRAVARIERADEPQRTIYRRSEDEIKRVDDLVKSAFRTSDELPEGDIQ